MNSGIKTVRKGQRDSERITAPQEIVPALKRGLAAVDGGQATVLEFITADEGEYSKFAFR